MWNWLVSMQMQRVQPADKVAQRETQEQKPTCINALYELNAFLFWTNELADKYSDIRQQAAISDIV